jgi:hypothetical protein
MRARLISTVFARIVAAAVVALALSSCGAEPPPEGFHLKIRFTSLDPNVLDSVRVTFDPMGTDQVFMFVEPMSYADGKITTAVDADGVLVLTIDGPYLASVGEVQGDGSFIFDLEVWSDDERVRMPAPFVRVLATRGAENIAQGDSFLPAWPLPLGSEVLVQVPCRGAVSDRCFP